MIRKLVSKQFILALLLTVQTNIATATTEVKLSFDAQTNFVSARLAESRGDTLAVAGRDNRGAPMLALVRLRDEALELRELSLPADAVAIDVGGAQSNQAFFVLCASGIVVVDRFDATPKRILDTASMFRGRSFAELTTNIDFATDTNRDGIVDFLVQDFDVMHAFVGPNYETSIDLALPSVRRGYDRAAAYRPARVASVQHADKHALVSVRGNTLLEFSLDTDGGTALIKTTPLALGLSDEFAIEAFYNGYDSVDQSEVILREPELLSDINADGLPDLVTLETRSTGVFDKESTYRVYNGRVGQTGVVFPTEPDSVLSSRGFQFGLRAAQVDRGYMTLISPGIKIGIRTIIGALFSKSVTLQIAIYVPDSNGVIPDEPSTTVRPKIRFDFSSGQAQFPTIEFGDMDGDGLNDLVLKARGDKLVWRRNLGNSQFSSSNQALPILAPSDGSAVAASDLSGDGRAEIAVRYSAADGNALNRVIRITTATTDE